MPGRSGAELRLNSARPQILPNSVARQLRPPRDLPNRQVLAQCPTPNNAQNAMSITPLSPAACSHGEGVTWVASQSKLRPYPGHFRGQINSLTKSVSSGPSYPPSHAPRCPLSMVDIYHALQPAVRAGQPDAYARSLRDRSSPRQSCPVPEPCRSAQDLCHPTPKSSACRHAWNGTPPSPRNADPASARSARSAPARSSGKQRPALFSDPPCLMHFHGSRGRREPLPATPFMAGSGGGWIVSALVLQDRE